MKLEELKQHHIEARKQRNAPVTAMIGMLISQLESKDKKGKSLMDKKGESYAIMEMLKDTRNNNNVSLRGLHAKGGNEKLIADLMAQNGWIDQVLPMLSDVELMEIIKDFIKENHIDSATDLPKVMSFLERNYLFRYNGKIAAEIIKSCLE